MSQRSFRALVVDDHPIMVSAVVTALNAMRVFQRVDPAASLQEAIQQLEENPACQLAVLDMHLADSQGRESLELFRERFPDVPVLVFSGDESLDNITMAFECGARGYVPKSAPTSVLNHAIRLVLDGGSYIPPEAVSLLGFTMAPPVARAPAGPQALSLSARQQQVFQLLLQGMPNKVIASRLSMAEGTAKAHLNTIYRVLGVRSRVEALLRARELGMI